MAQIVAALLLFLSAASLIRTKPLHETNSNFQSSLKTREKRALEKAIDVDVEEELHRTVKKAGKQIWEMNDLTPTEELHGLGSSTKKLNSKHAAKITKSAEKSTAEDEILELAKISKQQRDSVNKAKAPKPSKLEQSTALISKDYPSSFEDELKEMESLWQRKQAREEVRDLERLSRMRNGPHGSIRSVLSDEEKHRLLKRMKSDAITAYPNYADFKGSMKLNHQQHDSDKQSAADISKEDQITNFKIHADDVKSKSKKLVSREKKHVNSIKEHGDLLNKAIRMRRSLVHLSSENSMSEASARAMRRRKRDNTEALQEELEQEEELNPQKLLLFRNLLDTVDDKYYKMKGADSVNSEQDNDSDTGEGAHDEQFEKRSSNDREEEEGDDDSDGEDKEEIASRKNEAPEKNDVDDDDDEISSDQTSNQLEPTEKSESSLLMSLVEYKGTRGFFIPLDQEIARRQVASLMAKEALETKAEEESRIFALANLLARTRNAVNKPNSNDLPKREASFDYPLNVMERSSPPDNQSSERQENSKTRQFLQDLKEYLFNNSDN